MSKEVVAKIKLEIVAGQASPAPPVGPALGQHGVNIMGFCKDYNERTKSLEGSIVPVEITVFEDRTFTFITKTPPASDLLKKALSIEKGSGATPTQIAGQISKAKINEIAKVKQKDLNALDLEGAARIIEGTARSMGIKVE